MIKSLYEAETQAEGEIKKEDAFEGWEKVEGESEEQGEESEPWLVSYADLMTLLFSLFAMMFSFATFDAVAQKRMEKALNETFGAPVSDEVKQKIQERIKREMAKTPDVEVKDLTGEENGLAINFTSSTLFDSGKAALRTDAMEPIQKILDVVSSSSRHIWLRVEGYTDDNPISSAVFPSNWELSGARASTIIRYFEEAGFPSDHLEAIGYGSARAQFPNRDNQGRSIAENQSKNRRVLIKVLFAPNI